MNIYEQHHPMLGYQEVIDNTNNQWFNTVSIYKNGSYHDDLNTLTRKTSAYPPSLDSSEIMTATQAFAYVTANAGCRTALAPPPNPPGVFILDDYDQQLLQAVFTGERFYPDNGDPNYDLIPGEAIDPIPNDGATVSASTTTTLWWLQTDETDTFKVFFKKLSDPGYTEIPPEEGGIGAYMPNSKSLPYALSPGTDYKWYVESRNGCGKVTESVKWDFTTSP